MREEMAGRVQAGGSAGAVTSPLGSAPAASSPAGAVTSPPASSPLGSASAVPCWNLEIQGIKLDVLALKRRQARGDKYEEELRSRGDQHTWDSIEIYRNLNLEASGNVEPVRLTPRPGVDDETMARSMEVDAEAAWTALSHVREMQFPGSRRGGNLS